jgi:hypothetical protein
MTAGKVYCRHCEDQIVNCLAAAHEQESQRVYFLTLAWRWARLARDLETRGNCGDDCPLHKACAAGLPPLIERSAPTVGESAQGRDDHLQA